MGGGEAPPPPPNRATLVGVGVPVLVGEIVVVGVGDGVHPRHGEGTGVGTGTPHAPASDREPVKAEFSTHVEGERMMARLGAAGSQSFALNVVKSAEVAP